MQAHNNTAHSRREFLVSMMAVGTLGCSPSTFSAPPAAIVGSPSFHNYGPAPEFTGIAQWHNSPALSLASLRGKVVLVDFWTYSCINCLRTLPYVNRWAKTYADQGLVVVGMHTPEFAFERSAKNLQTAMQRFGVKHPVAQDNDYATWKAYNNQYWPAHYLVDAKGQIQYRHFGEGRYDETEAAIRALLADKAVKP